MTVKEYLNQAHRLEQKMKVLVDEIAVLYYPVFQVRDLKSIIMRLKIPMPLL